MKRIGFWEETRSWANLEKWPDPRNRNLYPVMSKDVRELIIGYIETGEVHQQWMGYSYCRFECGLPGQELGACDMTDGTFVWPEGLSHYVRDHKVDLPEEFVKHVLKRAGRDGEY